MRQLAKWLAFLLFAAAVPIAIYKIEHATYSWKQKLTVSVETPEGPASGSSVTAVEWWDNFFRGGWGGADKHYSLTGEAVVVDLGKGRYLFAPLKPSPSAGGESIADLAAQVATGKRGRQWSKAAFRAVRDLPRPATVPAELYPLLVTFDDIADPTTVRQVDPSDLGSVFGPGYALKAITLEITDEKVTWGEVERALRRKPGDGSLDDIWQKIPGHARSILSSVNWIRDR